MLCTLYLLCFQPNSLISRRLRKIRRMLCIDAWSETANFVLKFLKVIYLRFSEGKKLGSKR